MTRNLILILVIAIAAPGLAGCGGGKSHGGKHRAEAGIIDGGLVVRPSALYLVGMDSNGDFRVERAEFERGAAAAFTSADANHSGFLTPVELADWSQALAGDRYAAPGFMGFDANVDQKVTREEFGATLNSLFAQYDRDGDGAVTRAELVERLQRFRGGARAHSRGGGFKVSPH